MECYAVCVGVLTGMRHVSSTPKVGGNSPQGSLAGTLASFGLRSSASAIVAQEARRHLDFAVADNPKPAGLARPPARGARPITTPEICRAAGEQSVSQVPTRSLSFAFGTALAAPRRTLAAFERHSHDGWFGPTLS